MKLYKPLSYSIKDGEPIIEGYTMKKPEAINRNEHGFFNTVLDKLNYKQNIKLWKQSKVTVKVDQESRTLIAENIVDAGEISGIIWGKVYNIDFLADRIEVRTEWLGIDRGNPKAFLLPGKEDIFIPKDAEVKTYIDNPLVHTSKHSYTIEEIEKAIDGMNIIGDRGYFKEQIINNLKK